MRVAYYGLSSPIFYDYKTRAKETSSDLSSSPNPILDSAFGTIILFDELWFFSESLCPQNLRGKPYVKFLDKIIDLKLLNQINVGNIWNLFGKNEEINKRIYIEGFNEYWNIVKQVGISWEAAPDNHTHQLQVGEKTYYGNSMNQDNVVFDLATVEFLKQLHQKEDINLITNSFTQSWLENKDSILAKAKITELLIINNIPNYLTKMGPYHECIEEVRENKYLADYRKWISERNLKFNQKELQEVKLEIENQLDIAQRNIFCKYLDPKNTYKSIAKTIIGGLVDIIIPNASSVFSIGTDLYSLQRKKDIMWQGFIISTKNTIKIN